MRLRKAAAFHRRTSVTAFASIERLQGGLAGDREGTEYAKLGLFLPSSIEPRRDVLLGDDEGVAVTDGIGIPNAEDVGAAIEHSFRIGIAEGASGLRHFARR